MSQFITTHDANGKAVFTTKLSETQHNIPIPLGQMTMLYTTHQMPTNIEDESDIDQYLHDRTNGLGPGVSCPSGGTSVNTLHLAPGLEMPMRRLPVLGVFYVLEGEVTLHLDSGESRKLKAGDAGALRGAMHRWTNDTPDEGWAKLISFAQSVKLLEG